MADYRLFFLGSDGAIEARHDFAAPDDDAAVQIMAIIGKASADAHHGVMLWQGTRRIFEIDEARKADRLFRELDKITAARIASETQQRALDCEELLLNSRWRLAKSEALLRATAELRGPLCAAEARRSPLGPLPSSAAYFAPPRQAANG
jgi:hypothetical protein